MTNSGDSDKPDSVDPVIQEESSPSSSGLFTSSGIKLLLASGAALVVTSAYLFVRSYWELLPGTVKFSGFALLTAMIYSAGLLLSRRSTPITGRTLLGVGMVLLPFTVQAANLWVLDDVLTSQALVALGSLLVCGAAVVASWQMPVLLLGLVSGLSFMSALHFGAASFNADPQVVLAIVSAAVMGVLGLLWTSQKESSWVKGLLISANGAGLWVLGWLAFHHFFLAESQQIPTSVGLLFLGVAAAMEARALHPLFAHAAGGLLLGAGAILLHSLGQPIYTYGYFFVPAGLVALLRAWSFERAGQTALAKPYFHWGQMAVAGSLFTALPVFTGGASAPLLPTLGVLMLAMGAYAAAGTLYRQSAYSYIGGLVFLLFIWTFVWGRSLDFASATLFFTAAACGFLVIGAVGAKTEQQILEGPFMILGLGTLTVAIALLAGRWGQELFTTGRLIPNLPPEQIRAGLWTGGLSVVAYGFLAGVKKKPAFLYPALLSATWVYICFLEMGGISVRLSHISWIIAVSMALHYVFLAFDRAEWGKCFSLWGQMVFAGVAIVSVIFAPSEGMRAALIAGAAFLPGLFLKRDDLTSAFLASVYLIHNLVFRFTHPVFDLALYGLHLIPVNCGVIFVRALISLRRPDAPVNPFRISAFFFSAVSLGLTFFNPHLAWQACLAYGAMALLASFFFYQGRFIHVGSLLLLVGAEMFLRDQSIHHMELYLAPFAAYLFVIGFIKRADRPLRDFLYGVALVAIYLPASINALSAPWEWQGVFLAGTSAALLVFGLHQRSRVIALPSFIVLIANAIVQSRGFFLSVQPSIYLGLGGLLLLGLGGLLEFRRETILKIKDKVTDVWDMWD